MTDPFDMVTTFLRVYKLPGKLTNGFCFGGGVEIGFLNVDWFNFPIDEGKEKLVDFIKAKNYFDRSASFLVLADDRNFVFTIDPEKA